jgi:ribonuclease HI
LCLFDDHPVLQESIGWATTCDILTAEIAAIAATLEYIQELFEPEPQELPLFATKLQVSIFSDSRLALEAIKEGNGAKKGRSFLWKIAESFFTLQKKDIEVEFRWIPGHSGICGNEQADIAAKEAASGVGGLTAPLARRVREAAKLMKAIEQDRKCESDQFDPDGLPGQYT